jgi:hypothetical protein
LAVKQSLRKRISPATLATVKAPFYDTFFYDALFTFIEPG